MRIRSAAALTAVWVAVVTLVAACPARDELPGSGDNQPRVVVSLPPLAWFVERLAGDRVTLDIVLPPATAPELWSPSPSAMLAVARSDLFFYVGHPAIAFEQRLLEQAIEGGAEQVSLMATGDGRFEAIDPHLWLDPDLVREVLLELTSTLGAIDPDGASAIEANAARLVTEIERLDSEVAALFDGRRRSVVVTQHSAWGRLLSRYGVREEAIEREGKEPEPARMVELVALVRSEGVPTIFTQSGLSDRSGRLLAREVGAEVVALDPLAREWAPNLRRAGQMFARALH